FWQRTKPEDLGLEPVVDHEHPPDQAVAASQKEHVSFPEYLKLAINPVVVLMGVSYFSIKYLRYALDSWLPTFLDLQGLDPDRAAYYSSVFDWAGLAGSILAGIALDRIFRSRWEILCLLMGVGAVVGYLAVLQYGGSPVALALCFGLVGFMLYGPDTILCGAGAVTVAGQRNAVAVAGLVNGIGSLGPIVQEQVNGRLLEHNISLPEIAVRQSNTVDLSISMLFVASMVVICAWVAIVRRHARNKRPVESE
ncbi:MAG: MFS transporter, partial [Planctomycetaceae bacterium]